MSERRVKNPPEESLAALARAARKPVGSSHKQVAGTGRSMPVRQVPRWYRFMAPILFSLGGILSVIGMWAVGAVFYMNRVTPIAAEDIKYPLLQWSDEVGASGGYSPESRMIAYAMLACIPVAIAMAGIVMVLRRQITRMGQRGE